MEWRRFVTYLWNDPRIYTSVSYDSEDTMLHSIRRELNMRIINDGYDSVSLVTAVDVNAFIS